MLGGALAGAAAGGARGGRVGAFTGCMLGALGGDEAVTLGARALGMEDTRGGMERAQDAATLATGAALGHAGGAALSQGLAGLPQAVLRGWARKSVGEGKRVSARVDIGCSRRLKNKKTSKKL